MSLAKRITLEIEASVEGGIPEGVRRAVDENSRTLKFTQHGNRTLTPSPSPAHREWGWG